MKDLKIARLHERHPGVTQPIGDYYCEGATVCLSRHHHPPKEFLIEVGDEQARAVVEWLPPNPRAIRAWANDEEATRDGAYAISLAAVEAQMELVAIHRAYKRSGVDYYVAPVGVAPDDLENSVRLEVSGVDRGDSSTVKYRLKQKQLQARRGESNLPAIAIVVGFQAAIVALSELMKQ